MIFHKNNDRSPTNWPESLSLQRRENSYLHSTTQRQFPSPIRKILFIDSFRVYWGVPPLSKSDQFRTINHYNNRFVVTSDKFLHVLPSTILTFFLGRGDFFKRYTVVVDTLRILTPSMETPDPPNDTPGALKQVVLTPHDMLRVLRVVSK